MSSGKPVVTTTAGGSKEYVEDGESGIVVAPRDAIALAEAISDLLLNEDKRLAMGVSARKRILEHFDPTSLAEQTIDIYKLAIQKYSTRKAKRAIYSRPSGMFLADMENMLIAFDRMIYEMLYVRSWRFRLKHRFRRASSMIRKAIFDAP